MMYIVYFDRSRRRGFNTIDEALDWAYSKKKEFPMYGFTIYKNSYDIVDGRRIILEGRSIVCRVN